MTADPFEQQVDVPAPAAAATVRLATRFPLSHLHVDEHTITEESAEVPAEVAERARAAAAEAGFAGHLIEVTEES